MKDNNIPELDGLAFSDDKTLTELSEDYPVLSDMEKERIYKASEKKYSQMTGEPYVETDDKEINCSQEIQYSGSRKKTSRYKLFEIAACLLITAGIVRGVIVPLSTRNHQGSGPVPSPVQSTAVSTVTEKKETEVTYHQISDQIKKTDQAAVTTQIQKQTIAELEDQMKNTVIPELISSMYKINLLGTKSISSFFNDYTTETSDTAEQDSEYFNCYFPVRSVQSFTHLSEIREFTHQYMTDRLISEHYSHLFDSEHPRYIERNNKLYANPYISSGVYGIDRMLSDDLSFELNKNENSDEEITSCMVYFKHEYSYEVAPHYTITRINLILSDGSWKIDEIIYNDHADTYSPVNDEDPAQILRNLLKVDTEVCQIMTYGTSFIDLDDSIAEVYQTDQQQENNYINRYSIYYRVIDKRYSNISELKQYLRTYYTDNMFNDFCAPVSDDAFKFTISNFFKESDGVLYCGYSFGKSGVFIGWSDAPAEFTDVTDTSFTAKSGYVEMGGELSVSNPTALITCVKETDGWKIDKITFD